MKPADPFPGLLRAFFYEWMVEQRNASAHTIRSYRDTWRLFLRFVAQRRQRTVAQLRLSELTASEVSAFLQYTEQERHDSIGTRNCRLAALRSFFSFVAGREPAAAAQCADVLRIPTKKAPVHAPSYLDPPEVEAILAQPDRSTLEGQRDHALLSFLYNTGARIQEALDVCPQTIRLDSPACVRLRQGSQGTPLPTLAGNRVAAQSVAAAAAAARRRTDLRQSLRRSTWRLRRALQAGRVPRSCCQDRAELSVEACNASQLPSCDCRTSGCSGC